MGDPSPPVYLSHGKMDQAFLLHFRILQAIKNWMVGRSGNKAITKCVIEQTGEESWQGEQELGNNELSSLT